MWPLSPFTSLTTEVPGARLILGTTDPGYIGLRSALMRHSFERYSVLPYRAHHYFLWHGDDATNHSTPADADGAAADGAAADGTDGAAGTEETASVRARAPRRPNARLTKRLTKLVTQHRPIHLFFAGNCRRRDGGVRATILAVHDRMRATAQRNVVVNERVITGPTADWQNTSHVREAAALTKDTAQQMLASELCLCPAGDTLSSRRLFDARVTAPAARVHGRAAYGSADGGGCGGGAADGIPAAGAGLPAADAFTLFI